MKQQKLWLFIIILVIASSVNAQNAMQQAKLIELAEQWRSESQAQKKEAVQVANEKGWPIRTVNENGRIIELMRLNENGMPIYYTTQNADGAALINSDKLYIGGAAGLNLSGAGQTLGEWDGGDIRTSHQELVGRVTDKDGVSAYGIADHPTHVAGTMIASGVDAAAKGMSFAASLDAYDWTDDESEMATAAAAGLKVSQHSYSLITGWAYGSWSGSEGWHWFGNPTVSQTEDYNWGFYSTEAKNWDNIVFNAPNYLIVKSAGNDRGEGITSGTHYVQNPNNGWAWETSTTARQLDGGSTGYQSIAHAGTSKNIMTVGAVDNTTAMSSFSGWGPTDDGRIKPDIVAKGVSVYSSLGNANNTSYASWNGTSMSGPMVSGSVGLLLEHQENLHPGVALRSATMKGLITHTATDLGNAGPDYVYGWGLMNTEAAAEVMTNNGSNGNYIVESSLSNGQTETFFVEADGSEPLEATIIWTDPAGTPPAVSLNPTDLMLVNDLDMRIEDASAAVFYPYILDPANPANAATTGDNTRDNIEKVRISTPTAGVYTITISHKGTLNGGSQNYSLIVTCISEVAITSLPYIESFDTDLGDCNTYSVSGDTKNWHWYEYGGNGYAKMNGYNSGDTEEDWLILPGINADDYTTITMDFETAWNFGTDDANNYLKLYYSTDYIGTGDPGTATWSELTFSRPATGNYTFENSGNIDLSSISGQFYLGFKYHYEPGNYREWQIDDINITSQELITFYFRGPNWMNNNPHDPEIWGPFNGWSGAAPMTYDNALEWWRTTIEIADASAEITYQSRFSQDGITKYQKAFGDFADNPTFTTTTGEIWIDASDNDSFTWNGNDFYLALDKITENEPITSEPANHVTNFAATADSESQISLSWTDSDATFYLVKGSSVGYGDISAPVDGTTESDGPLVKNVGSSLQSISFGDLDAATAYYFKIFPYNGSGSSINYKTNGTVPQANATTEDSPTEPNYGLRDDEGVNLPSVTYWYTGQTTDITEKGSEFDNKALGELTALYIKGANIKSWKSGDGDVTGATFSYKIWESATTEPDTYTEREVNWTSNDGGGNQTWADFGAEIEASAGLAPGNYSFKIFFSISGTGIPGITENGPFTANFVVPEPAGSNAEILTFTLDEQTGAAVINSADATVTIEVANGTALTNLTPTITVSENASVSPASGVAQDFSTPVEYTVTAEDLTEKVWTVTVTEVIETYPVEFSVTDGTESYLAIEIKGSMTDWATIPMTEGPDYFWTITLDIPAGTFEWGAIENDGSDDGIWLIDGPNLSFTVSETGEITGTVSYNIPAHTDPEIGFANLQWPPSGTIEPLQEFNVYAQAWIENTTGSGTATENLQAWIGYSTNDTDPDTWTDWIEADFSSAQGNNDEFFVNLGAEMTTEGTFYYASRFKYLDQDYVYGGFDGGFWDGVDNVSGVLSVTTDPPDPEITFANLQFPASASVLIGESVEVYAQVEASGVTLDENGYDGMTVWIGYSSDDTDPAGWTNWFEADYSGISGFTNRPEYLGEIGSTISEAGTYYYASRFQLSGGDFVYGGFDGGFWDGVDNVSGQLVVMNEVMLYPITFTATDATGLYSNIKFKGEMTNWETIPMEQNGENWTLSFDILPGTYEWGLIEDDGSPDGIWLIEGPNLEVNISIEGAITGDTSYLITFVGLEEMQAGIRLYPNPVKNKLYLEFIQAGDYEVQLLDTKGQLISRLKSNETRLMLPAQMLESGTYIIRIISDNIITTRILIKQ